MTEPRCVLFHDNFQNFKSYNIPKAQLVIADIPYNIGTDFYASRPDWYVDGDNKNGESDKARKIIHGGNPVLRWMAGNVVVDRDPAENIKPTKAKSPEKIDGIVATIMALDRCIRNQGQQGSVYDERPLIVF